MTKIASAMKRHYLSRAASAEAEVQQNFRAEADERELAQEQFMRAAAEAECERLREALATILDCGSIREAERLAMAALADNSGQDAAGG